MCECSTFGYKAKSVGGAMAISKIAGVENPADLMTKYLAGNDLLRHCERLGIELSSDRAKSAPTLATGGTGGGGGDTTATLCNVSAIVRGACEGVSGSEKDEWSKSELTWLRVHRQPRRTLFTPMRVNGSPPASALTGVRITRGTYFETGKTFELIDQWTSRASAHADLGKRWVGETTFLQKTF